LPEAVSLAAAHKRIHNILRQAAAPLTSGVIATVQPALLEAPEEQALYQQIETLRPQVQALFNQGEYAAGLRQLAHLKDSVNAFFDAVMVMVEDAPIRQNRLALLTSLATLFGQVAEFSRLQL
jgi:glycyl-tRNA synthetase beta subunit